MRINKKKVYAKIAPVTIGEKRQCICIGKNKCDGRSQFHGNRKS